MERAFKWEANGLSALPRRIEKIIWAPIFWGALIFWVSTAWAEDQTVTVFTEQWAPYNYEEDGAVKGISVEIVQKLMDEVGATAKFVILPSMRSTATMAKTPGSMFISLFRTEERENKYHWVGPIVSSSVYFYKRVDSALEIDTLEDAKGVKRVASRYAGLVHTLLQQNGFTNLEDTAKNGREVYRKLLAGRSDLGISDSPIGVKYILQQLGLPMTALTQTSVKILDMDLYIAVHKSVSPQEVKKWQAVLDRMKASGRYDQIIKKYSE
ncbi:substrate-binding periplasmic protein [Terasakiella pusilla]|uniref:substrate-binding periplasmic protein n=1 Tax=Terasakiella pusilla TaxID=64973 RepID=UPI003AA99D9A